MNHHFTRMHNEYLDPDRYHNGQDTEGKYGEVSIDLKWSLWTEDQGIWQESAPEALNMLKVMLNNTLVIHTAPKKEIRFGTVTITGTAECSDAKGELRAVGNFEEHWDEPYELADTLGIDTENEEDMQCFVDGLPIANSDGDIGVSRKFDVTASSVAELLKLVDAEEAALILDSEQQWRELEAAFGEKARD